MELKDYQVYRVVKGFRSSKYGDENTHLPAYQHDLEFKIISISNNERIVVIGPTDHILDDYMHNSVSLWEGYIIHKDKLDLKYIQYYAKGTDITFLFDPDTIDRYAELDVLATFKLKKETEKDD